MNLNSTRRLLDWLKIFDAREINSQDLEPRDSHRELQGAIRPTAADILIFFLYLKKSPDK